MNTDNTPTTRTDAKRNKAFCNLRTDYEAYAYMANHAEKLERELAEKTNEVARLRELLNRAIEIAERTIKGACGEWGCIGQTDEAEKYGKELTKMKEEARLAPAPEETQDGATMDEWYGGFSKIESTDPVPSQSPTQTEWRELGPDEVIQEGDEYFWKGRWYWPGQSVGKTPKDANLTCRTRRPLPKQEEMHGEFANHGVI
jgi:hypothetical protein